MSRNVPCPICGTLRLFSQRYPNALCNSCGYSKDLVDSNGNPVTFTVTHDGCGAIRIHHEHGMLVERRKSTCFLKGIECHATEARFGGIAVQVLVSCPGCSILHVSRSERHLGGVCDTCVHTLVDANDNPVRFDFEDRWEHTGIVSLHDDHGTQIKKNERTCFLNGRQCTAYHHDGVIIVQLDSSCVGSAIPADTSGIH